MIFVLWLLVFAVVSIVLYKVRRCLAVPASYHEKIRAIQKQIVPGQPFTRARSNHTYRNGSNIKNGAKVDMSSLTSILSFDPEMGFVEVEGNIKVTDVVRYLLKRGYNITSVADLSQLTLSGLLSGVGGGASSFRNGYFHNQVLEADILLGDGSLITVDRRHELLKGIPRTLGTMGYVTRMKIQTRKVHPYVRSINYHYDNPEDFFKTLSVFMDRSDIDFMDGVIFSPTEFVLITGSYLEQVPKGEKTTNVTNDKVYYEIIRKEKVLYFDVFSFIYRYETDLYFTSMSTPAWLKTRWLRRLIPKFMVKTIHEILGMFCPINIDMFCSDVMIPSRNALSFYRFYEKKVNVFPCYICPVRVPREKQMASFWEDDVFMVDFGLGYGVLPKNSSRKNQQSLSKMIENVMIHYDGCKLPYTDTFLSKDAFERSYFKNFSLYQNLRRKYGFEHFKSVHDKRKFRV